MSETTARTGRFDVKLYAARDRDAGHEPAPARDLVPVFHRWIQRDRLTGELLIDVADYSHVHEGPGVLLVAHEGIYAYDGEDGRPGLQYSRRRAGSGESGENGGGEGNGLRTALRRAVRAAHELEADVPSLDFPGGELLVRLNDRLASDDGEAAEQALRDELAPLLAALYPGRRVRVERSGEPRERLTLAVRAAEAPGVGALLERLEAVP
ncbi:MAG TPA: hypothetical protein VKU40_17955 [Thermoanaerobaculia bacterium]|nr:hypothetical protein [Thermoanaerobaculia bacterium]